MPRKSSRRKRVVILGGGFGGVYTAQSLLSCRLRNRQPDITIVSRSPYFEFKPLFIEVLGRRLGPELAQFPLERLLDHSASKIKITAVTGIDAKRNIVGTEDGEIEFDYLVIALGGGSVPVPTTKQTQLFSLESVDECIRLRDHIDELRRQSKSRQRGRSKAQDTVAIVGAGPTGVEAATEIFHTLTAPEHATADKKSQKEIILVESEKRILPAWGERLRASAEMLLHDCDIEVLTRTNVKRIQKSSMHLENGKKIAAGTFVWCGGLKGSPVYKSIITPLDNNGHLRVNSLLQLPKFAHIYAIGDAINTQAFSTPVPQSAQAAYQQARVIAHNILNSIEGKPLRHFRYFELGEIMPMGGRRAIAYVFGIPLDGHLAWMLEKSVYIFRIPGWLNKVKLLNGLTIDPLAQKGEEYLRKRGW